MKLPKLISFHAATAFCGLLLSSAPAQTPLALSNGDFEQGVGDWRIKEKTPMTQVTAESAHGGERGLRVEDNDTIEGSSAVSPRVEVQAGSRYRVTFWGRTQTPGKVAVYAWFYKKAAGELIKQNPFPAVTINKGGSEWHQYTLEVTAPDDAVHFALWVHSLGSGTGSADLDDFTVELL